MSKTISCRQIQTGFCLAAERLKLHKDTLNQMNLFPVADRDTGINMARTMEDTAAHMSEGSTPFQTAEDAYMQMLDYSCGNSGTILTLFFEGFTYGLPEDAEYLTGKHLADAFVRGADNAMACVTNPKPGTILTVALQSAQAGLSLAEMTDDAGQVMYRITQEAHEALMQTAHQNPVLKDHNVVDSGAYGFCLILDGFLESFAPEAEAIAYGKLALPDASAVPEEELLHRFCTEFVLEPASGADLDTMESMLRPMGSCFLCAGSTALCKVHIHTDSPEDIFKTAKQFGTIVRQKVDDMSNPR